MAAKPRPIENLALDFQAFIRDLEYLLWTNDNQLDAQERALILRARKKLDRLSHMNAMDALIKHLQRLDVDDEVTSYSEQLAERANLHIANLSDHRPAPEKVVPFPHKTSVG